MNIVAKGSLIAGAAIAFACSSGLVIAGTQAPPNRGASVSSPPDITGSWERFGGGAVGRGQGTDPRTPPPTPPPPLRPQFLKAWQDRQQAARAATAKGQPIGINWVNCLPDGMPGMMQGPFPFEILQTKGQVTIIQESFTQVRRILLNRPPKSADEVDPTFFGYSVGRWDGNTLIVDTVGIKEQVRYQNAPHSDQMRIRERFRLLEPDLLV